MVEFYIDKDGSPRVRALNEEFEPVAMYLENDVQATVAGCDFYLEIVSQVENKNQVRWEGTGNAFTLTIEDELVTIESEFGMEPSACQISLDELRQTLHGWKGFIQSLAESGECAE